MRVCGLTYAVPDGRLKEARFARIVLTRPQVSSALGSAADLHFSGALGSVGRSVPRRRYAGSVAFACLPPRAPPMGQTVEPMDRITVNADQCGGRPCIRGMRIRVSDVLDLLAAGLTSVEVVEELPDLELEDVAACLRFASRRLGHPVLAA